MAKLNKNKIELKSENFKNNRIGIFLHNIKFSGKEYCFDILVHTIAGKGGNPLTVKRKLLGLRDRGYFDISERNNKTFFKLTIKGLQLAELIKFSSGKLRWDRKWRILIFDIPEKERYKRDFLRRKLMELGFKQLQQSVWITPYPLPESFSKFLEELRVRPYLYSIVVDKINRVDELKKYFGLK